MSLPDASPATCSPPSTTSASPSPTSTRRSPSTATPSAWRPCTRRPTRSRACARRWSRVGDSGLVHPAARAAHARLDDREVPRPLRPRRAAARLPGRATSRPSPPSCASAACACCTTSRAAARRAPGSTSSTPRTPAACWSSSSSPPQPSCVRPSSRRPAPVPADPLAGTALARQRARARTRLSHRVGVLGAAQTGPRTTSGANLQTVQQIRDAILAGDTSGEEYAALTVPESYRAVTVHKDEVDMFDGPREQGQGPAQVAARRRRAGARARARARRWSR